MFLKSLAHGLASNRMKILLIVSCAACAITYRCYYSRRSRDKKRPSIKSAKLEITNVSVNQMVEHYEKQKSFLNNKKTRSSSILKDRPRRSGSNPLTLSLNSCSPKIFEKINLKQTETHLQSVIDLKINESTRLLDELKNHMCESNSISDTLVNSNLSGLLDGYESADLNKKSIIIDTILQYSMFEMPKKLIKISKLLDILKREFNFDKSDGVEYKIGPIQGEILIKILSLIDILVDKTKCEEADSNARNILHSHDYFNAKIEYFLYISSNGSFSSEHIKQIRQFSMKILSNLIRFINSNIFITELNVVQLAQGEEDSMYTSGKTFIENLLLNEPIILQEDFSTRLYISENSIEQATVFENKRMENILIYLELIKNIVSACNLLGLGKEWRANSRQESFYTYLISGSMTHSLDHFRSLNPNYLYYNTILIISNSIRKLNQVETSIHNVVAETEVHSFRIEDENFTFEQIRSIETTPDTLLLWILIIGVYVLASLMILMATYILL